MLEIKPIQPLSPQQKKVLQFLADGLSSKEIALKMGLATRSVRKHQQRASVKLGAKTQHQMMAFAVAYGFITVDIYREPIWMKTTILP